VTHVQRLGKPITAAQKLYSPLLLAASRRRHLPNESYGIIGGDREEGGHVRVLAVDGVLFTKTAVSGTTKSRLL
jgi:hypothetical protein